MGIQQEIGSPALFRKLPVVLSRQATIEDQTELVCCEVGAVLAVLKIVSAGWQHQGATDQTSGNKILQHRGLNRVFEKHRGLAMGSE